MINFIYHYQIHFIFRIILAGICGLIIGYERKNRAKEAGLRTHCIVACASALMMILSKYGFTDLYTESGMKVADGSRIAAQVVSGVGFLGAGMIFVQKNTIKGLTTAAGIWATSGIGMSIGAGMYIVGIASTVIILIAQIILHRNTKFTYMPLNKVIKIKNVDEKDFQKKMIEYFNSKNILLNDVLVERRSKDEGLNYVFYVEIPYGVAEEEIIGYIPYESAIQTMR